MLSVPGSAPASAQGGRGAGARPPAGASSCTGCHAAGAAIGGLDGRPEAEIADALAAYRTGERPGTIMARIAKGFDAGESRAIAGYFSGRVSR